MPTNCTPCRCRKMVALIHKIAAFVCEKKCDELIKDKLPELVEEEVKKYLQNVSLKGIHAQLYGSKNEPRTIEANGIIPFTFAISNLSEITLSNGEFTVPKTGNYLINWTVVAPIGATDQFVDFSVSVNGIPKAQGGRLFNSTEVDSACIIALEAGDVITLKNISGQEVILQTIPEGSRPTAINFQANIVISYIG